MLDLNLLESLSALTGIFLLYPETHYVFRWLPFSRYKKKEPEIITDAPYRLEPGCDLPLLLIVKDAHRYPVTLKRLFVKLSGPASERALEFTFDEKIDVPYWHKIVTIPVEPAFRGFVLQADNEITYERDGEIKKAYNDNLEGLSHAPLKIFCASAPLPALDGWVYGDLHYHSSATDDQVEFGAPLEAAATMAQAIGMSFLAATDHWYDLDDCKDDYLKNDPNHPKWHAQQNDIRQINAGGGGRFVILPGEEVSCANTAGCNVHALVFGHPDFLPGSGDSAEKWFRTDAELSITELVQRAPQALVIAAHPKDPALWLEKIFIRRGQWADEDARTPGLAGLQILNGADNEAFHDGLRQWIRLLLKGERRFIYAGNDAHGNFNRYRQVGLPMKRLEERENHQRFGYAKTAVFLGGRTLSSDHLLEALRQGRVLITTGPLIEWSLSGEFGQVLPGDTAKGNFFNIHIRGVSAEEFGPIKTIQVIAGEIYGKETRLKTINCNKIYDCRESFLYNFSTKNYLRCELHTDDGFFVLTNPIWVEPAE